MADEGTDPGRRSLRYEFLTGGENAEATYYWARRKLNFSRAEWDSLAWWEQKMYVDGMNAEADASSGDGEGGSNPRPAPDAQAEASRRFAETGKTSLADAPADADFSGMDALMAGAKRRSV